MKKKITYKEKIRNKELLCGAVDKTFSLVCQKVNGHKGWHEAMDSSKLMYMWNEQEQDDELDFGA